MALFGSSRDVSFIRRLNRELMGNIISQQCAFYKYKLNETTINMYGEAAGGKFFDGPVLLNTLIIVNDNSSPTSDLGVDFNWPINFSFLRDDLVDASVHPEVGDVILYQESYWEVDNTNTVQYFAGKDPDYPYNTNPLNPGLENFGYNVSITCECHYIPADRVNIIRTRLL
tara:strand:- start:1734 stop:2246 length:513 start_codon:yes stop_codon:yes gene_type:complete